MQAPEIKEKSAYSTLESEEIAHALADILRRKIEGYAVYARNFFSDVWVTVGTRFYEISDAVASLLEGAEIEESAEEVFEEEYQRVLEEINSEHAVYVWGRIETEKYIIEFAPEECEEDYCIAGLRAEIAFKQRVTETDLDNIAELIAAVFRL